MKTLKLNNVGDLVITNGNLEMTDDTDELRQAIWLTLSINHNEWFINANFGLDYSVFFDKDYDLQVISKAVEDAIYLDPRIKVAYVSDIYLDKKKRYIHITGNIEDYENRNINFSEVVNID